MQLKRRGGVVVVLGVTQTVAWASSYYLPAILAAPMAEDLGVPPATIFAAFSFALLVSALLGPYAIRAIDRLGGRPVLIATNVLFAVALVCLGFVHSLPGLFGAWTLMGVGLGSGLYEAAFSALVVLYGRDSRNAISGITLIAGFASTVGWPLSSYLALHIGWRGTCFAWAALHLFVALPLNGLLPAVTPAAARPQQPPERQSTTPDDALRNTVLLAIVFTIIQFVSTALAAHLPRLLMAAGATLTTAVAASALLGPAQVGARFLEFSLQRHVHPMLSARLAALAHPVGAALLLALGSPIASVFVLLHGAGNGIMTIAKGTLPLVLFGPQGYGLKQGVLMVPSHIAQAAAPWLFGVCLDHWQTGALWLSSGLWAVGFLALLALRPR